MKHKIVIGKWGYGLSGIATKRLAELGCQSAKDYISKVDARLAARSPEDIAFDEEHSKLDPYASNLFSKPEERMDPLLIQVVEELGEKASDLGYKLSLGTNTEL